MAGYTNRGLGVSDVPLRFNCRGEVAVITLRRSVSGGMPRDGGDRLTSGTP